MTILRQVVGCCGVEIPCYTGWCDGAPEELRRFEWLKKMIREKYGVSVGDGDVSSYSPPEDAGKWVNESKRAEDEYNAQRKFKVGRYVSRDGGLE